MKHFLSAILMIVACLGLAFAAIPTSSPPGNDQVVILKDQPSAGYLAILEAISSAKNIAVPAEAAQDLDQLGGQSLIVNKMRLAPEIVIRS